MRTKVSSCGIFGGTGGVNGGPGPGGAPEKAVTIHQTVTVTLNLCLHKLVCFVFLVKYINCFVRDDHTWHLLNIA